MVDVHSLSFYPSGQLYLVNGRTLLEFELRDFTGVTDKKGAEIYDKDVVEMRWRPIGAISDRTRRFVVVYTDGGFKQLEAGEVVPAHWYKWSELEVIGNIYENPELFREVI